MKKKAFFGWISISILCMLLLSFSFFFVGCGKKKEENIPVPPPLPAPIPPAPTPPVPTPPAPTPPVPTPPVPTPQVKLFEDISNWLLANGVQEKNFYIYLFQENTSALNDSVLIYDSTDNALTLGGDNNSLREVKLLIPKLENYDSLQNYQVTADYIVNNTTFSARLTLPTHKFSNITDSIILPKFDFVQQIGGTDQLDNTELAKFRATLLDKLNLLLTEFNKFYVEKMKGGDQSFNGMVFKYFYLPAKLTIN